MWCCADRKIYVVLVDMNKAVCVFSMVHSSVCDRERRSVCITATIFTLFGDCRKVLFGNVILWYKIDVAPDG